MRAAANAGSDHPWATSDGQILELTDALIAHAPVDDAAWAALDGVLDDGQRLELMILVGFYAMLATMFNTVGVELDPLS